jgi:hypothetical protein
MFGQTLIPASWNVAVIALKSGYRFLLVNNVSDTVFAYESYTGSWV